MSPLHLLASKPGYRAALGGKAHFGAYRNGVESETASEEITLALDECPAAPSPLVAAGEALRAGGVAPYWRVHAKTRNGGGTGIPWVPPPTAVDDRGLALPGMPTSADIERAHVLLPTSTREAIAARFGVQPGRSWTVSDPHADRILADEPILRLDEVRALEVVEPDGRPSVRALIVHGAVRDGRSHGNGRWTPTSRTGDALIVVDAPRHRIVAVGEAGWGVLDAAADSDDRLRLTLEPFASVPVTVVDHDGEPVPQHSCAHRSSQSRSAGSSRGRT